MKKITDFFFSIQFAVSLLLVFAVSIAVATFIENDYGTAVANALVYKSVWLEVLLFVLAVSLTGNVVRYKLIQRKKWLVLVSHLAFVLILAGGAITRFFGYEGTMSIREGETSNHIIGTINYLQVTIRDGQDMYHQDKKVNFHRSLYHSVSEQIPFGSKRCRLNVVNYIPNAGHSAVEDPDGGPVISLITVDSARRRTYFIQPGDSIPLGNYWIGFNRLQNDTSLIEFQYHDSLFTFIAPAPVIAMTMVHGTVDTLAPGVQHPLQARSLYSLNGMSFVVRALYAKGKIKLVQAPSDMEHNLRNAVVMNLQYQGITKEIDVFEPEDTPPEPVSTNIGGVTFTVAYGPRFIRLPFSLRLRDFKLERYPGSMSPSSFESEVTLIDPRINLEEDRRIYMNNVLSYEGYRFYQSSYDKDEKGTILSVNHDFWGTLVSYAGYFFLTLGLILNLFTRKSRFRDLIRKTSVIRKKSAGVVAVLVFILLCGFSSRAPAQEAVQTALQQSVDKDHAKAFGELLVQDQEGRIKPVNTLSSEILHKVSRKDALFGLNPDQVILGMVTDVTIWQKVPMIRVSDPVLRKLIGVESKYASFNDFFDLQHQGRYKIAGYVDEAYNKKPASRTAFDKDIIKVDERLNICYMVYSGSILKIFPKPGDLNNAWYSDIDAEKNFDTTEVNFVKNILPFYYASVDEAIKSGKWETADQNLKYIQLFQQKYGRVVMPSQTRINAEIFYNRVNIFKRLFPVYGLLGFLLLILLFINILGRKGRLKVTINILTPLIVIAFIFQTIGLALRWYISGHAPWSDGYETMIYISWGIVLSGLIFAGQSRMTLAVTALLASLTLMVADMSWMDPEITNLVPVLKSFWLVIHVAVITASYSFLAIGALLGFINLVLMIFQNEKNSDRMRMTIEELTNINEINLIIGLILVTIGTFLGAVWANESWGRYWGWDPKETWALITVLVYAFITHLRLIPGLKGRFAFNFAALLGFSSVLMTYFGVNYYLSGLHSYASGEPAPVPVFVYYTIALVAVVSALAYWNNRKINKAGIPGN